ncbi:hypothetical protein D3C86_1767780 [compost metagenome]
MVNGMHQLFNTWNICFIVPVYRKQVNPSSGISSPQGNGIVDIILRATHQCDLFWNNWFKEIFTGNLKIRLYPAVTDSLHHWLNLVFDYRNQLLINWSLKTIKPI